MFNVILVRMCYLLITLIECMRKFCILYTVNKYSFITFLLVFHFVKVHQISLVLWFRMDRESHI